MEYRFKGDIIMRLDLAGNNPELVTTLEEQIKSFLERNMSKIVGKSPDFIIRSFIEWQFSRYAVHEADDAFFVNDLKKKEPIICISKKDPQAYYHAYSIRDDLNRLECEGTITVDNNTYVVGPHEKIDEIIDNIEKSKKYTIDNIIKDTMEGDEE